MQKINEDKMLVLNPAFTQVDWLIERPRHYLKNNTSDDMADSVDRDIHGRSPSKLHIQCLEGCLNDDWLSLDSHCYACKIIVSL